MALIVKNRVRETTATTGTGALALAGAVSDHRTFASVMTIGDTAWVTTLHPGANAWETGLYTYSALNTLTRTTIYDSTNANAAVNFGAGTKEVFLDLPASKLGSTEAQIDASITTAKIADLGVTTGKLAANAVTSDKADSSVWGTGDVKLTLKAVADANWLMMDDTTIGPTGSGAGHTGATFQPLFNLLFANINDTNAPLLTIAGGATTRAGQTDAATAWAAGCRMSLTKVLGRALAVAGVGSGLTSRALGARVGAETVLLDATTIPAHTHAFTGTAMTNHGHDFSGSPTAVGGGAAASVWSTGGTTSGAVVAASAGTPAGANANTGGGLAHDNMPPEAFLNAMIKL